MKHKLKTLNTLADPEKLTEPIKLQDISTTDAVKMLKQMLLIRRTEEKIAEMVESGEVKCPCHFAIGQEATAVGVASNLMPSDRAFGAHRSHSHFLASGGTPYKLIAEVLGKQTGASKGMGGSMHLFGQDHGFAGSVPIVAGTVPLAVGAALAAKMDKSKSIGIAYFGDGACEEGVVQESLNIASTMQLPILFVVENNLYSSHLDISQRQPSDRVARFAEANGIKSEVIDGNDVVQVAKTTKLLIDEARSGNGPAFIEAVTFRWRGHVGPDENVDVGVRRSKKEIELWKKRDPISRLTQTLLSLNITNNDLATIEKEITNVINNSYHQALKDPYPENSKLLDFVYA